MTEAICQRVVLAARPQGRPKLSYLRLEKVELRATKVQATFLHRAECWRR